jgi:type IV pilus assembly protein PilX
MRRKDFPRRQRGVILVTAMLLLIVVTIMALSMFRGYGAQERLAGNTRDKQRALAAAISAQQYAEFQLASGTAPLPGVCPAGILPSGMQVCLPPPAPAPLPNFATLPWLTGVNYLVFTQNAINGVSNVISATGTADNATQSASYVQAPQFNVIDLGPNAPGALPAGEVYQVDGVGFGGTSNTVAVVESTFVIGSNTPSNLGNP